MLQLIHMTPNELDSVSIPVSSLVNYIFLFIVAAYITFTIVLFYHWKNYSSNIQVTTYTLTAYMVTTVPLIIIMAILTFVI